MPKTTLTIAEILIVIAICFGTFIVSSTLHVASSFPMTGFDDSETLVTLLMELIFAGVAIRYLRWRQFDVASLVPQPTSATLINGVLLYCGTWIVGSVVTMPLHNSLSHEHIQQITLNSLITVSTVIAFAAVNGFYEEAFLLGVLQRGQSQHGWSFAIAMPMLVRLSYHTYQGPMGMIAVAAFGMILAIYYWRTRDLGAPVFAHILADITPFID